MERHEDSCAPCQALKPKAWRPLALIADYGRRWLCMDNDLTLVVIGTPKEIPYNFHLTLENPKGRS